MSLVRIVVGINFLFSLLQKAIKENGIIISKGITIIGNAFVIFQMKLQRGVNN